MAGTLQSAIHNGETLEIIAFRLHDQEFCVNEMETTNAVSPREAPNSDERPGNAAENAYADPKVTAVKACAPPTTRHPIAEATFSDGEIGEDSSDIDRCLATLSGVRLECGSWQSCRKAKRNHRLTRQIDSNIATLELDLLRTSVAVLSRSFTR